jgi:hypothetical protein
MLDNKRHGKGKYIYADGSKYEGEWRYDKMNGKGIHTLCDGSIYDGFW